MASVPVEQAREDVASLFLSYMKRAPEFQAMSYYVGVYNQLLAGQGEDPAGQQNAFKALAATIYTDASGFGEVPTGPAFSSDQYVDWIYENALGREADAQGREYWIGQLDSGAIDRPELVGIILRAAESDERDAAYVSNRTDVALAFARFENSNPNVLPTLEFNAGEVLEGVTDDPATVQTALDKLQAATGGGDSVNLTPGVDNLAGTGGDDVFNALPVNAQNSEATTTLNPFDTVDGGQGRDTLNIYTDAAGNNVQQQGTVRNVEIINIHNTDAATGGDLFGQGAGVDAGKFQGAEEVWQFNRANSVTNLGANTAAGFANLTAGAEQDSLSVNAAAATATVAFDNVSGDEDGSVDLTVSGASLNQVTLAGELAAAAEGENGDYVTLTVDNQGAENVGTFTLNTSVDTRVESINGQGITAINAAGSSGGIWYDVAAGVNSFTGGSGDDVIVFDRALELNDVIDGGEGNDTVILASDGELQTQDYDALGGLKNIENLGFIGADVTVDAAQLTDYETLNFWGTGNATVENLAADQVISVTEYDRDGDDVDVTSPDAIGLSNAAADVTLDVDLAAASDESPEGVVDLVVDGDAVGETGGTLTLTGESGRVQLDNNEAAKFATIDATGFAGNLTVGLAAATAETLTLGAGSTAIYLNEEASTIGSLDTIENFKAGAEDGPSDSLIIDGALLEDFTLSSGATTLNQAWAEAATYDGAGDILVFTFQGDTYLYADTTDGSDGRYDNGDFAIKLIGEFNAEQLQAELA